MELSEIATIKYLIEIGLDIHKNCTQILKWASEKGHLVIVEFMYDSVPNIDTNICFELLMAASNKGHLDLVKFWILKGFDDLDTIECIALDAAIGGSTNIVKYIMKIMDFRIVTNY